MSRFKKYRQSINEYFSLRPYEQDGLLVALLLVITFLGARFFLRENQTDNSKDIVAFQEAIQFNDSLIVAPLSESREVTAKLRSFDPNKVSKEDLLMMGIPPSAAKSIVNFRNAGFKYKKAEDLLRCFGVDEDLLAEIGPFVVIETNEEWNANRNVSAAKRVIKPFFFDPNIVTESELQSMDLPSRFVQGFINFRNSGARFYTASDVDKIYVMTPEIKDVLLPFMLFPEKPAYDRSNFKNKEIERPKPQALRFRFDPNTISKDSIILLGISERTANIWINYRNGGKVFYEVSDMQSIYGLDTLTLSELKQWMTFPTKEVVAKKVEVKYVQPSIGIDPNLATHEELQKINGIGSYYANSIIWYRDDLGGFHSLDQIGESKNLPDSVFQEIKYHFVPPSVDHIDRINVNKTSLYDFAKHPYMSLENAKRIISRRDVFGGTIEGFDFLVRVELLSRQEAIDMKPYLIFE